MARCVNCMSQGKYVFLFCLLLCLSGLVFLLGLDDRTRDLLQRTVQSQEFGRYRYSKHALVPLSGILAGRGNLTEFDAGQSNKSALHPSNRLVEANISVGPELTIEEMTKEEKKYRHDDQYQKYLRCPTTVRKKMLSDPIVSQKLVLDIPILMWDEHFNASEYIRLTQFRGINGWRGTSNQDVHKLLKLLKSPNNRYMFDDRLVKGGPPPSDCISCAVVGNGGILNGSRKGAEIDAHDYVFRVNTALTKGFESDVGAKTSFYCFTMVTLSNTLGGRRGTGFNIPKGDEKMRYLFFADNEWTYNYLSAAMLKQTLPRSVGRYHRSPPTFPRQLTPDNVKIVHPDFERYLKWSWVNSSAQHKDIHRPTTGAIMLLTALHTCDQVSIYGYAGSYDLFSEHYYDKTFKKHVFYANHDNRAENKLWELLHERGIVTLFRRTNKE